VYVPFPPEATTVALPVHAPLQSTFTCDCVAVMAGGCVMVTVRVPVHPFASVTVNVYVPAQSADAVFVAPAVVLAAAGDQLKVYGAVPPLAVDVAVPLQTPKQVAFVCEPVKVNPPPALATTTEAV
jgi:hypothetical protein